MIRPLLHVLLAAGLLMPGPALASDDAGADATGGAVGQGSPEGPVYVLEDVDIRDNDKTADATILFFVKIEPGESFSPDDDRLEKTRYLLLATGWFSDVELSLEKGSEHGRVILVIRVVERSTFVIRDLSVGITDITAYGAVSAADHNFLGRGITLGGGVLASDSHLGIDLRFQHPFIFKSRFSFGLELYWLQGDDYMGYDDVVAVFPGSSRPATRYARVNYLRRGGSMNLHFDILPGFFLGLRYRFEVVDATLPLVASHSIGGQTVPIDFGLLPGRSFVSTIAAVLEYDSRNDPFLPTKGLRIGFTAELSTPLLGSSYTFTTFVFNYDHLIRLPWKHSLQISLLGGIVAGDAPFFERFYIGDFSDFLPSRKMGMAFDHRRSPNVFGTSVKSMRYEDIAASLDLEYVMPLYRSSRGVYGVDFFFSAGVFVLASSSTLRLTGEGWQDARPFPIDFTADVGFRMDTGIGFFEFSLSNFLGLVPIEGP